MQALQLVSWNLTRRCNLACGHCYLDAVQRKSESADELSSVEALRVVDQIAATAAGAMLVMTGGEPLLRKDLCTLVGRASAQGLLVVVGTNGSLLGGEEARRLKAAGAAGVGISVDSAAPAFHDRLRGRPGAWDAALAGMRAARAAGLALQMQTTLFAQNRHELAALADLAESEGAMALNFFFLVCTGRGVTQTDMPQEDYEATLDSIVRMQRERARLMVRARCAPYVRRMLGLRADEARGGYEGWSSACLAGRSYLRITPQGRVTPCPYIPEVIGELRRGSLADLWGANATLQRLRRELAGGKCGDCDFRYSCGGCRARAVAASGNLLGEDPKCAHARPRDACPEPLPAGPAGAAVRWEPDARAMLERIPAFVRERVRRRIEEKACAERLSAVTLEFLRANRPAGAPAWPSRSLRGGQG
jgi:radical SAM protein with 4Fe4S-binding SPASM domain